MLNQKLFFQLIKQIVTQESITEHLKADNQMEWVGHMNSIRPAAEEIVNSEIILA